MKRCHWINQNGMQCGQPFGHVTAHGNGMLTVGPQDWHEYTGPDTVTKTLSLGEKSGTVWTEKSIVTRCIWTGTVGRCIYEQGHTIAHKEDHA